MAVYKSEKYVWNAETSTWDLYFDRTSADNIEETTNYKVLTAAERTKISNYLTDFNVANKLLKLNETGNLSIGGSINASGFTGDINTEYISSDSGSINIGAGVPEVEINAEEVIINGTSEGITLQGKTVVNGTAYFNGVSNFNSVYINGEIGSDGDALTFGVSILNFNDAELKSVADPVDSQDVANKRWVEQLVSQGTHIIAAVRAATTGPITSFSGLVTIDGVALDEEDRVLVKDNETTPAQNGVYIVSSESWIKIANDSDKGSLVSVLEGSTQKRHQYYNQTGSTWVKYWVDDAYYAAENGGLERLADGFGFRIKNGGITNNMIDDYIINPIKIQAFESFETGSAWGDLTDASNGSELEAHFGNLYAAIKLLRGTTKYNTNETKTISEAYSKIELKNSVKYGTVVPTGNAGGADGDVFLKRLA